MGKSLNQAKANAVDTRRRRWSTGRLFPLRWLDTMQFLL